METVVSIFMDKLKLGRRASTLIVLGISVVLGLLSSLGYSALAEVRIIGMQLLDFFDFFSNNILLPIVALLTAVFVGYVITPHAISGEVEISSKFKSRRLFGIIIRLVAPLSIVIILVSSILGVLGVMNI